MAARPETAQSTREISATRTQVNIPRLSWRLVLKEGEQVNPSSSDLGFDDVGEVL
ncbi:MAG: hypothetical protein ACLP50_19820 [Solirubrobacteraceae bacterium]|jgi:hypothetical protein